MPDKIEYVRAGYSEALGCYLVNEVRNGAVKYVFRGYIKGNKITLYPLKPMYTTEFKRDKIELSIFDIKKG